MYATFPVPLRLFVFIFCRLKVDNRFFVFFLHSSAGLFISFASSILLAFYVTIMQWVPWASYFFSLVPFEKFYDFPEATQFLTQ